MSSNLIPGRGWMGPFGGSTAAPPERLGCTVGLAGPLVGQPEGVSAFHIVRLELQCLLEKDKRLLGSASLLGEQAEVERQRAASEVPRACPGPRPASP